MLVNVSDPVEIEDVTSAKLGGMLGKFQGCWKASSILWMQANAVPVLSGVIIGEWNDEAEKAVSYLHKQRDFSEFLVRLEKPGQRWTDRRGGFVVPASHAATIVGELWAHGLLTFLLEPVSPYSDSHSLACVCDLNSQKIDVEVVGPGFDTSDILRGDSIPHERFEIGAGGSAHRSYVVNTAGYRQSTVLRLAKIGARLRNPAFPGSAAQPDGVRIDPEQLTLEATEYLKKSGQTLLLDHLTAYEPIPKSCLESFLVQINRIIDAAVRAKVPWRTISAAGSFVSPSHLVMWDFFSPESYETTLLANMRA